MEHTQSNSLPKDIVFHPIGIIHSQHTHSEETPIQPVYAMGCKGRAEILPQFEAGLCDLEGFSHIHILVLLHKSAGPKLTVKPFLQDKPHGVFATRSPRRPNPIGISLVRLVRREGTTLFLEDVDILDGTPILDIKPVIPRFDCRENAKAGWQDHVNEETAQTLGRRKYRKKDDASTLK